MKHIHILKDASKTELWT